MSSIIDNSNDNLLVTEVNRLLDMAEFSSMAVGFFYLSGFEAIQEKLHKVQKLRLLIGSRTNSKTVEEMVAGHYAKEQITQELRMQQYQTEQQRQDQKDSNKRAYLGDLAKLEQNGKNSTGLAALWELIRDNRIEIKVYTKGTLHSKAYIFKAPEEGSMIKGMAIVGSSNLSFSGLSGNSELNVKVTNENDYEDVCTWFKTLWDVAEPFDSELMDVVQNSWALQQATPFEVYIKTLHTLLRDRIEVHEHLLSDSSAFDFSTLYSFQRDAVNMAIDRLENPDNAQSGVFISDVVGLGKSYIALAILSWYWSQKGKNTLIICPPSLLPMWEGYKEQYNLSCHLMASSELFYTDGDEDFTLNDRKEFDGYEVVIIDEAHNFRNPGTQRYGILAPYLQGKKVVLLTATPQNKSVWDIYHQIKLFHQSDITNLNVSPNNLNDYFKENEENPEKISELLQHFIIRRTRNDIVTNPRYADLDIRFPTRKLETIEYLIDETYSEVGKESIYDQILEKMFNSTADNRYGYAIYALTSFVKAENKKKKTYLGLSHFGELARGLLRTLLFKRLESSAVAFHATLGRIIQRNNFILRSIEEKGLVLTGKADQLQLFLDSTDEVPMDKLNLSEYPIEDFRKEELIAAITHDIAVLNEVQTLIKPIVRQKKQDAKFEKFIETVLQLHKDDKILVFSEFTETVEYLYQRTKELYPNLVIERISSFRMDRELKADAVRRFSPNSQTNGLGLNDGEKEIQILFTSDVLSEGQNLQDAHVVVNYDFHWNPVRLIQRIGRVDRIGSISDEIKVYNFLPDEHIEAQLDLQGRVQQRINQIHRIFGSDSAILSNEEELNEESVFSIYSAKDEGILDVDNGITTLFDEAEKVLNQLKLDDPIEYERIISLDNGIRAAQKAEYNGTYAYLKSGNLSRLYYHDGNKITDSIAEILGLIKADIKKPESFEFKTEEHTERMKPIYKRFKEELKRRKLHFSAANVTPEQKHFQERLRGAYNIFSVKDDTLRKRIDRLNAIFKREIPDYAKTQLRMLKRQKLSDELMFEALERLVDKAQIELFQKQEFDDDNNAITTVCSEAMVK